MNIRQTQKKKEIFRYRHTDKEWVKVKGSKKERLKEKREQERIELFRGVKAVKFWR